MTPSIVEATHTRADQIRQYYGWRATNYDAGSRFEVEHHLEAIRRAQIQEGQRILEVACGTGRATVDLAQAVGEAGHVEALDLSEAMLEQARAKLDKAGWSHRVTFAPGDARHLPFSDAQFDLLYNGYMFDLIPLEGFAPILAEFFRVLKPGGRLVLVNMSKPDNRLTMFERIYSRGWAVMPCRPVLMSPYLKDAGFVDVDRLYRPTRGFPISLLWGQEIVTARKPV